MEQEKVEARWSPEISWIAVKITKNVACLSFKIFNILNIYFFPHEIHI